MMQNKIFLKIAEISVCIKTEFKIYISDAFLPFISGEESFGRNPYLLEFQKVSCIETPQSEIVYKNREVSVYASEKGNEIRVFQTYAGQKEVYALAEYQWDEKRIQIKYLSKEEACFCDMQKVFKHIAWEAILMHERKLMLHASYLATSYGGIAFSGPSGIGKTTQAGLWKQYGNGKVLNGDKVILEQKGDKWIGYGSPYAGSSKCYINGSCELKYLFFLKQGQTCELKRLSVAESFKQIYAGLTVNRWNTENVNCVCELAEQLAMEIPAYEFTCTPDEEAVYFLQGKLQGGEIDGREQK